MKKWLHFLLMSAVLLIALYGTVQNWQHGLTTLNGITLALLLLVTTLLAYAYHLCYPLDKKLYTIIGALVIMTLPLVTYAAYQFFSH